MRLINCIQAYPRTFLLVLVIITAITLIGGLFVGYKLGVDTALHKDEEFINAFLNESGDEE